MQHYQSKNRILTGFILLSGLVHLFILFPLGNCGLYHFAKPVNALQPVMISLEPPVIPEPLPAAARVKKLPTAETLHKTVSKAITSTPAAEAPLLPPRDPSGMTTREEASADKMEPVAAPEITTPDSPASMPPREKVNSANGNNTRSKKAALLASVQPPLRTVGEFTTTSQEQLSYRISLLGMPVGTAELVAKNEGGEFRISLKVKSSPALAALYPVNDLVEVRHVAGNFIITKIRQQEGNFLSNRGFTIFLRDKRVFWIDLLRNRSLNETVPTDQVLDLVSAFYYLRNRPLEVGTTESLHVYDSDTYSLVPVEVLRRERLSLPAFRHADTLMIRPRLKTDGIFKHTGEVTIWLTDDEFKVPVRFETSIPLGKITAELVSAVAETREPASAIPAVQPTP